MWRKYFDLSGARRRLKPASKTDLGPSAGAHVEVVAGTLKLPQGTRCWGGHVEAVAETLKLT
jgi:hypothetical protein